MTSPATQAARFLQGSWRAHRDIVTPEGVLLHVELADFTERLSAFLIDLVIWLGSAVVAVVLLATLTVKGMSGVILVSVLMFVAFLFRNFYFIHFELRWQGSTPGKRLIGIRVADRHGGPLLPTAVIARNLTREVEFFIPLGLLMSVISGRASSGPTAELLLLGAWVIGVGAIPFINRDRMRAGDLVAGTIVLALPRLTLLRDLVDEQTGYKFADTQLRAYGTLELHVLEDLLRRADIGDQPQLLREVSDRICRKIGWTAPLPEAQTVAFLRDFYAAQRAYLEREQLFGRSRADKHQVGPSKP
jgi:uncharacterized RDD family membrane protein YckC